MPTFTRGPVTIGLTTLWEKPRDLTPEEKEVVEDIVRPQTLASGERRVSWSCAACGGSGGFTEGPTGRKQ